MFTVSSREHGAQHRLELRIILGGVDMAENIISGFVVWQEGLDMPLAYFSNQEEMEEYLSHWRRVDELEREFREWFDGKVLEYGISPSEARDAIRFLLNNV
jgi:hypothetical protein